MILLEKKGKEGKEGEKGEKARNIEAHKICHWNIETSTRFDLEIFLILITLSDEFKYQNKGKSSPPASVY